MRRLQPFIGRLSALCFKKSLFVAGKTTETQNHQKEEKRVMKTIIGIFLVSLLGFSGCGD